MGWLWLSRPNGLTTTNGNALGLVGVDGTCGGILLDVLLQRQVPGKTLLPCMLNPTFIVWHLRKGESHGFIFLLKLHLLYLLHFLLSLESIDQSFCQNFI